MLSDVARLTAALSDRYRIEREIGAGGMATVYIARDLKHDRAVAVKVLKPRLITWDAASSSLDTNEVSWRASQRLPQCRVAVFDHCVVAVLAANFVLMPRRQRIGREKMWTDRSNHGLGIVPSRHMCRIRNDNCFCTR